MASSGDHPPPLTTSDLSRLLSKYIKHKESWNFIGLELGIEQHILEGIRTDFREKSSECFREMLTKWLQQKECAREADLISAISAVRAMNHKENIDNRCHICGSWSLLLCASIIVVLAIYFAVHPRYIIPNAAMSLRNEYKSDRVVKNHDLQSSVAELKFLNVSFEDTNGTTIQQNELIANYTGTPGCLAITGKPGSGKTTFLRYLAKEWAEGRALKSCQILFLVHFQIQSRHIVDNLTDLINLSEHIDLLDIGNNINEIVSEILNHHDNERTSGACFLLDGYENANSNFLNSDKFRKYKHYLFYILTSRSITLPTKDGEMNFITITGFSFENLENNLNQLLYDQSVAQSVLKVWNKNEKVKELCTLPLHMVMLISICAQEQKKNNPKVANNN